MLSQNLPHSQIERNDSLFQGLVQVLQSQEPKLFPVAMNPTQSIGYVSLVSVMERNAPELPKAVVREERVQVTEASKEGSGVVLLEPVVSFPCSDP